MATAIEFVDVAEAAAQLKLSTDAVYRFIRDGKLRAAKFGRAVRIPRAELERFVAAALGA